LQKAQEKKIEEKKIEAATNEKMRLDRVAQERAETVRELEKQSLNREKLAFEKHQIAERMRDNVGVKQEWHSPPPAPVKTESSANVQKAREEYISGGEKNAE
jgi:signal transduction histidine kinase